MHLTTSQLRARALSFVILYGCASAEATPGSAEPAGPVEVGIVRLATEPAALQMELAGRTTAFCSAEVRPQVTGIVKVRHFREGSQVRAGQVLYTIDDALYRAAHLRARAELASAELNQRTSQGRAERYAKLLTIRAASQQEHDDAQTTQLLAAVAVEQARASLLGAEINLDFSRVVAPIGGRIGRSSVTRGALVTAGQSEPLATIAQLDPIFVDVTQSSAELLRLKRRLASGGALPASARVRLRLEDGSDYDELGALQFTEVTVDPGTGSVTLRALFPNPDGMLLPGMYVRAFLEEALEPHALLVPQQAVIRDEHGRASVFLLDATDTVEQRAITTERAIGDRWLVTSGLRVGDRVISEGIAKVKPGMLARPVTVVAPGPS